MLPIWKAYLIIPGFLLAIFSVFERDAQKIWQQKDAAHLAQLAVDQAAEEVRRATLAREAETAARQRALERDQQERDRAAKKLHDYENTMRAIEETTAAHATEAEQLRREVSALELQLAGTRANQERIERDAFGLAKEVEQNRVERRAAEMETQRLIKIVGARLLESRWVNSPRPGAAPGKP